MVEDVDLCVAEEESRIGPIEVLLEFVADVRDPSKTLKLRRELQPEIQKEVETL